MAKADNGIISAHEEDGFGVFHVSERPNKVTKSLYETAQESLDQDDADLEDLKGFTFDSSDDLSGHGNLTRIRYYAGFEYGTLNLGLYRTKTDLVLVRVENSTNPDPFVTRIFGSEKEFDEWAMEQHREKATTKDTTSLFTTLMSDSEMRKFLINQFRV